MVTVDSACTLELNRNGEAGLQCRDDIPLRAFVAKHFMALCVILTFDLLTTS